MTVLPFLYGICVNVVGFLVSYDCYFFVSFHALQRLVEAMDRLCAGPYGTITTASIAQVAMQAVGPP